MALTPHNPPRREPPLDSPEERLLAQHLGRQLDPHLGNARRRFEQMLAQADAGQAPLRIGGGGSWRIGWTLGAITAVAACVLLSISLWPGISTDPGRSPIGQGPATEANGGLLPVGYTPLEYRESWQSQDLGTYEFDGRPVRAVHRQQLETARYRDEKGYEIRIEVPREQIVLVDAQVQ